MSIYSKEADLINRALQLAGSNTSPMFNIAPILELVRQADAMGFDVIPRNQNMANQRTPEQRTSY